MNIEKEDNQVLGQRHFFRELVYNLGVCDDLILNDVHIAEKKNFISTFEETFLAGPWLRVLAHLFLRLLDIKVSQICAIL